MCTICENVMLDILMARSEAQQQQKAAEESTRSKADSSDIDDDLDALGMTPQERAAIRIHVAC